MGELGRFDHVAQGDRFAARVRDFDSHRRFAGNALDQDRLGAQRQAKVFGQARDPAVFDSRLGLEFESGDHRPGIDLRDVAADIEFRALLFDRARAFLQLALVHLLAALGRTAAGTLGAICSSSSRPQFSLAPAPFSSG